MRITRRDFAVSTGALIAAAALLGSAPFAFADPTQEELMRPGPLPDIVLGKADAPVTLVEYASSTCPHCAAFDKEVFPALKAKYIDTGKVRYVFREFSLNELDILAFMLVRCAATDKATNTVNSEKAIALIEVLFASQDSWVKNDPIPPLQQIMKQAGMTDKAFEECAKDEKLYNDIVAVRDRASKEFKVSSTPTIFVNGKMHRGNPTIDDISKQIDPLLPS